MSFIVEHDKNFRRKVKYSGLGKFPIGHDNQERVVFHVRPRAIPGSKLDQPGRENASRMVIVHPARRLVQLKAYLELLLQITEPAGWILICNLVPVLPELIQAGMVLT